MTSPTLTRSLDGHKPTTPAGDMLRLINAIKLDRAGQIVDQSR